MKKFLPAFIGLLMISPLASCSPSEKTPLIRSGDLLVSTASTYGTIGNGKSVERMIKAMDAGESVLFLLAAYNCSVCHTFERSFITYLRNNQADVYVYYLEDDEAASRTAWWAVIDALVSYYGYESRASSPFFYTPTFFLGSKDKVEQISEGNVSESNLNNSINSWAFYSNAYRFSSFSNFQNATKADGAKVILYSESDAYSYSQFYSSTYSEIVSSSETTYILDYDSFSEEEKIAALGYFSLSEYAYTIA